MKNLFLLISLSMLLQSCNQQNSDLQATSNYYEQLTGSETPNISGLTLFMSEMPKGGDVHHHYSGSIYAETYLEWVKKKGWYINPSTLKIEKQLSGKFITVDSLYKNNKLYNALLGRWSDKDFDNHDHPTPAPDQQFFNTFGYFGTVSGAYVKEGLHILKKRAQNENVSYIETMLQKVGVNCENCGFPGEKVQTYNDLLVNAQTQGKVDALLSELDKSYFDNKGFNEKVKSFVDELNDLHKDIDTIGFKMRYQTYAARLAEPLQVYIDLLSGYKAAEQSDLVVGVNIVAAENSIVALRDYELHMMFFNYLNRKYPGVNKALHAGELAPGMVRPKNLLFHINQAVHVAGADRIGHGVDIEYETAPFKLLEFLKDSAIAIEINLTSNEFILGIEGNRHPYLLYSKYDVPMVISTDDSGVSRNSLTDEYVKLASRYKPPYSKLKEYVYNSITYSFLKEADKNEAIADLDRKFTEFEQKISTNNIFNIGTETAGIVSK